MTESYYPFDAGAGGNVLEAEWAKMARLWAPTGVVSDVSDRLAVTAGTGMAVEVAAGAAWIRGHYYETDAPLELAVAASDPTDPRIDRIVARLDRSGNLIEVDVLTGVPATAGTQVAPGLTQTTLTWEISLAQVAVPAGAAAVGTITDERTISLSPDSGVGLYDVRAYGAVADGVTDDRHAIQAALDAARDAGGGTVVLPSGATLAVDTSGGALTMGTNVTLDGRGGRLLRIGANKTNRILENEDYGTPGTTDLVIRNLIVQGTGAASDVNGTGHCIGFWEVDRVLIEDVKTVDSNADGISWREADNVTLRRVSIGSYGRNGISPTSGIGSVWDDVEVTGSAFTGANPGIPLDCEPNNASEVVEMTWHNVRARSVTFVDFHTPAGGAFSIQMQINNCRFDNGFPAGIRLKATNKVAAEKFVVTSTVAKGSGGSSTAGVLIDNVDNVELRDVTLASTAGAANPKGITIVNSVSNLFVAHPTFVGTFDRRLFVSNFDAGEMHNSEFVGCPNMGTSRITGTGNRFYGCDFTTLELLGAATTGNIFDAATTYNTLSLLSSATKAAQTFERETLEYDLEILGALDVVGAATLGAGSTIGGQAIADEPYVAAAVASLVDSSPATLDTLNELAEALGDDPNFATTMTDALSLRVRNDSPEVATTDLKDVLVAKGLLTDGGATPLNLDGGALTAASLTATGQVIADGGFRMDNAAILYGEKTTGSTVPIAQVDSSNRVVLGNTANFMTSVQVRIDNGTLVELQPGAKLGFYGAAPVTKPAALTAADASAINSGDATTDAVIANIRTRLGELEDNLQALGLQT